MIQSLDESVGRVLRALDETGIADRTVVIFSSDNGGYIQPNKNMTVTTNAPLRSGKGSVYEGGIRVPLIVRWPGVTPRGASCDVPVVSTDLFRTMLSMAGIDGGGLSTDGVDLTGLLKEPSRGLPPRDLFFHYPHYYPTTAPVSAIRSGDWKLIEYFEDNRLELYKVKNDIGETRDIASTMPERVSVLHAKLKAWRESVQARVPSVNPAYSR